MIFSGFPSVVQFVGLDVKSVVIDEFEYKSTPKQMQETAHMIVLRNLHTPNFK
jgi:hypothetical protein